MITFSGIEWDYNNLQGIGYDSDTLLEPYGRWFYQITAALNYEKENIDLGLTDDTSYSSIYKSKESTIKIKDYSSRKIVRVNSDEISLSDNYGRKVGHHNVENITLSDRRVAHSTNKFKESIVYLLDEARSVYQRTGEPQVVVDQVELSGSACLFDFEAKNGVWDESEFNSWCEKNCPVNYNELRPFIPGEYEYTDAYVGFKLTIPPTSGRFGVAHSTVYIDVEDTVEKGTAEHTLNGNEWNTSGATIDGDVATVEFSKRFYTSPHIITSLNFSEENCYIEVVEVGYDHFKFKIKSINTGSYVTSAKAWSINWLADGY